MTMLRFDPFREFDRMTGDLWGSQRTARPMPMDVYRDGERYLVCLDCPGINADSLELTAENNTLTISADRRSNAPEGTRYLVAERPTGTFTRQLVLGDGLDLDNIDATYHDGVLTIAIPVAEQAKPRRISVGRGDAEGHRVIAGESQERPGMKDTVKKLVGSSH
ncbi:Hsp20/alpha crystallin family protein [Pilimelia columellifera]|uniref:Molecular chaperone Hsp18 n=1 Tax=Pilimelia columellifera subsp. columellifera TaxID=706583 RepID=A0ABN3N5V1_9ACTN